MPTSNKVIRREIASYVANDQSLLEMVYDPIAHTTALIHSQEKTVNHRDSYTESGIKYVPFSPNNTLLQNRVILLPTEPTDYGSSKQLIEDIKQYLYQYVDISESFALITSYYVLFSWVFDRFNELPYLRVQGDYGTGKSRFLLTVGALCYKPIFASGASTVSPLFHILSRFGGTLIIDEADFRYSDEMALMTKILNNGNVKGMPVLRSELDAKKVLNPRAFSVYGPKMVATRGHYQDKALESRFITETMGHRSLRPDIPINLPNRYHEEALRLRNKLLRFRLDHYQAIQTHQQSMPGCSPRTQQLFTPLLSIVPDASVRALLIERAQRHNGMQPVSVQVIEKAIVQTIHTLANNNHSRVSIKAIAVALANQSEPAFDRSITTRWIGQIVRQQLQLTTRKTNGVFVIDTRHNRQLQQLYQRYHLKT